MIYQLKQDERFLRLPEVKHITALSRAHIYLLISKDEFPKQYKLGQRAAGWLSRKRQEVSQCINRYQDYMLSGVGFCTCHFGLWKSIPS